VARSWIGTPRNPNAISAAVLADAENGHATGNARLAVQLLTQANTQARRITTSPQPPDPAALAAICAADIPERMPVLAPSPCDQHPASTSDSPAGRDGVCDIGGSASQSSPVPLTSGSRKELARHSG
jgi:hypothetical protein